MRQLSFVIALTLAPAASFGAGVITFPTENGVSLSYAADLSADGRVVVGGCTVEGVPEGSPCRWTEGEGYALLESPVTGWAAPLFVSGDGSVVAGHRSGPSPERVLAVRWGADGQIEDLVEAPEVGLIEVSGLSADGEVIVGHASGPAPDGDPVPFRWTAAGGMELAPFTGHAFGVSADGGTIVGRFWNGPIRPYVWRYGEDPQPLPEPNGSYTLALGVSGDGEVVVGGPVDYDETGPWSWTEAGGVTLLGSVEFEGVAAALDASHDGSVIVGVGHGSRPWFGEGFVWDAAHGRRSVKQALMDAPVNVSGWSDFYDTVSISADGTRTVGWGAPADGSPYVPVLVSFAPACSDGIDNDGDGAVDMTDPQCMSPNGRAERRSCGLGFEIALVIAPLAFARARRRATRTRP